MTTIAEKMRAQALAELHIQLLGQYTIHMMAASETLMKADEIFPFAGDFSRQFALLLKEMKEELARRLVVSANSGVPS